MSSVKPKRYRAGKPPEWAHNSTEDESDIFLISTSRAEASFSSQNLTVSPENDSRLRRISESRSNNGEQLISDRRRIHQAEVVSTNAVLEENEEELDERRRKIREKLMRKCGEEKEVIFNDEGEDEEEMDWSEEEEEERIEIERIRCLYLPKSERATVMERERMEEAKRVLEEKERRKLELRKVESKGILLEEINKDKNMELAEENVGGGEAELEEEENGVEEYEAWKAREIARIKRAREIGSRNAEEREIAEAQKPLKKKWRFMQRYYHKGAFFQDENEGIYERDCSAPTGEDKMDKRMVAKVMQVKKFGRRGRTKWTHLLHQDTTSRPDNPPYVF